MGVYRIEYNSTRPMVIEADSISEALDIYDRLVELDEAWDELNPDYNDPEYWEE